MIGLDAVTALLTDYRTQSPLKVLGELLHQMDSKVILTLGIKDLILPTCCVNEITLITNLSSHLSVERCLREYNLIVSIILLLDLTIAQYLGSALHSIIPYEVHRAISHSLPVTCINSCGVTSTLLLLLHRRVKALLIDIHSMLRENKSCQIKWETIGIVEHESIMTI